MYRAHDYLREAKVSLAALVAAHGRSSSTWSRLLNGKLEPEPAGIRKQVEQCWKQKSGRPVPRDFWKPAAAPAVPGTTTRTQGESAMLHRQTLSSAAQRLFKLPDNPFDDEALQGRDGPRFSEIYVSRAQQNAAAAMQEAIRRSAFVAVYGESGSGKNITLELALHLASGTGMQMTVVRPRVIEWRKLNATHLTSEIIRQVTDGATRPPSSANERDSCAERVLSERYRAGHRTVLLIDEAHEIPTNTLKDLKRIWEMRSGFARLVGIILTGQSELGNRLGEKNYELREVSQRCSLVRLDPLDGEVAPYLASRFRLVGAHVERVFTPDALVMLERRLGENGQQYPLHIGNAAIAAMNVATSRGNTQVTDDDVDGIWTRSALELQDLGRLVAA
jgi:type II secretory pathway predicted ATPase ExeA